MDHQREYPNAAPAVNVEMGHPQAMYPPPPTTHGQAMNQQQLGAHRPNNWVGNDANTLLVVATLITTLTYQLGTNVPGGYWQETKWQDGMLQYSAGDPIMRDLDRPRYWVFRAVSSVGFVTSVVMTQSLLLRMAVNSRHVRWPFAVAYSCLVVTFIVSQPRTVLWLDFLFCAVALAFLWLTVPASSNRYAADTTTDARTSGIEPT